MTDRDAVERGLAAYDDLHASHQEATARAESFERSMVLANAEHERLRREIKQVRAQRDHFMRAYAGLKATLQGFTHFSKSGAAMLDQAIHMAEVQAYAGEQLPGQQNTVLRGSPSK